jgi:mannan endo-1,4-beta-mannosidase
MARTLPLLILLAACTGTNGPADDTGLEDPLPEPDVVGANVPADFHLVAEAEQAWLTGGATVERDADASGGEAVHLHGDGGLVFTVEVPVTGVYAVVIFGRSPYGFGKKFNHLEVNGERTATFKTLENPLHYAHETEWGWLEAGLNQIAIEPWWGYAAYDRIELQPVSPAYLEVSAEPVTPAASDATGRLLRYLVDHYGVTTLAGQQNADYLDPLYGITGRDPAVLAVDFIRYSPSRLFGEPPPADDAAEDALWWADQGGIVTISWHWNAPTDLIDDIWVDEDGNEVDASWYKGFYTYATTFDLEAALADPDSERYGLLLRDIDAIAVQLDKLAAADVPVLWRPLHEASGGWFWWGAKGPEPYLDLWELLYDRLTHHHGLDNLIWVWNGQHEDWYPGDDRVDIVAVDVYGDKRQYPPLVGVFGHAKNYSDVPKLVALSESGTMPDPDLLAETAIPWSWFNIWSGDAFVVDETWNEHEMMEAVYAHERIVTLDELPDLATWGD